MLSALSLQPFHPPSLWRAIFSLYKDIHYEEMKASEIQNLKELLKDFFEKTHVKKAILFGSTSKDLETTKSDLDLMIVMDTNKRFFRRYDDLEGIYEIISDRSVDLLVYTPDELRRIAHRRFIKNILEKGYTLYEH